MFVTFRVLSFFHNFGERKENSYSVDENDKYDYVSKQIANKFVFNLCFIFVASVFKQIRKYA